jgi:DNA repair protein RAD7
VLHLPSDTAELTKRTTDLPSPALESLAYLNANLTSLRLDFCGLLDNAAFKVFSTSLPALTRIELLGPFLVRSEAWQTFFKAHPILEGFLITQSPRFDVACAQSLVQHCPGLKELRLKEVGKMSDEFIEEIMELGVGLTYLDISDPTDSCSDDTLIGMLSVFGAELTYLNVSKHRLITDRFLTDGLAEYTQHLDSLLLSHLPELTDKGVADFFGEWNGRPPMRLLELARNHELGSAALEAIMKHSGKRLEELNINGWKEVGEDALRAIGRRGVELRKIDVSWCREMDDFIMKAWFEGEDVRGVRKGGCMKVKEIKLWGCNKITNRCQKKVRMSTFHRFSALIGVSFCRVELLSMVWNLMLFVKTLSRYDGG